MNVKPTLKFLLMLIILAGLGALVVWGVTIWRRGHSKEAEQEEAKEAESRVKTEGGESVVTLDPAAQTRIGIASKALEAVSHQEEIKAYGVIADVAGLLTLRGNAVDLAQSLLDTQSAYAAAKTQAEKAKEDLEVSSKAYERLKALHADNRNISDKALETAEAAWRAAESDTHAAEANLNAKKQAVEGAKDDLLQMNYSVKEQWGDVIAQWLSQDSEQIHRILRIQDLVFQLTLPPTVHVSSPPPTALIQTPAGSLLQARFVSACPHVEARIQGPSFFYVAPAPAAGLTLGMNVFAFLPLGPPTTGVAVPEQAVVWWQGKAWVYVQKDQQRFARREISTESPLESGYFVTKGLAAGDRVVVTGAQILLSEEFRSQIQETE